jgi:uncharacterized membrane protein YhaH (DUF805 family)
MQDLFLSFNGRINRSKFWLGILGLFVVYIILAAISAMSMGKDGSMGVIGIIILVIYIAMIWPSVAIGVKRFHDRDKSGWWVLISLVPIIGGLWYLIECGFLEGTKGPNKFGPDPLANA